MTLYIWLIFVQSFMKISHRYHSYRADTILIGKISKGHNSIKNVDGVTVLFLCILSDSGLYFYKIS